MENKKKLTKKEASKIVYLCFALIASGAFACYLILDWQSYVINISATLNKIILSVFTVLSASVVRFVAKALVRALRPKSQRSLTVTALLNSLVSYSIGIATIFLILVYFLGYDYIMTLVAGLGILTLVVGLGCQSLISDIVAGVSMVIEGEFHVGDVVVIDDWRGKVKEIGLRTTVIQDVSGNMQIINNSQINKIVNNSKELSICLCDIGIEYSESLERVEKIIEQALPTIKEQIPLIKKDLTYLGVQSLADSAVVLRFSALSKEDDKFQVQRDMNRQFKLLFDKHKINIPFPQATISYRDDKKLSKK